LSGALEELVARLGLSDDEALAIFRLEALEAISGEHLHRPEVEILDALTREADERVGALALGRWLRGTTSIPTPLELLERGEWGAFEQALADWLRDSGVDVAG
jgi:hypothetical protein